MRRSIVIFFRFVVETSSVRSRGSGNPVFAAKPGSPLPRGRTEFDERIQEKRYALETFDRPSTLYRNVHSPPALPVNPPLPSASVRRMEAARNLPPEVSADPAPEAVTRPSPMMEQYIEIKAANPDSL